MIETIIKKVKKNKQLNRLKNKYPMLVLNWVIKPLGRLRFKNEARLYQGKQVVTAANSPSILFFTVHKCASTLVVKIIRELSIKKNIVPIDIDGYIITHQNNDKSVFQQLPFLQKIFKPTGFYYGALRYFRRVPDMDKYKTFLMLRDPRDVITSMYFSIAYSHTVFDEKMIERRAKAQETPIDEFVLRVLPDYKKRYEDYIHEVLNKENVLFLKYEDMVSDFPSWLSKMSNGLGIYDEGTVQRIIKENDFSSRKEDKHSHIRNVQPGDHLNKLKPRTIQKLNEEFQDILTALNYI